MLVVDDVKDITWFLGQILALHGYEIASAYDGVQAIATAKFFRPHVILLNVIMPRMDGFAALPLLRAMPELTGTKIILQTALVMTPDRVLACGADGYLGKPFFDKAMLAEIKRVLQPC